MASKDDDDRVAISVPRNTPGSSHQSGNPKGRPKHARDLKTEFLEELGEVICIREGDREMKISKQRAFVKALVAAAIKGDMRAASALVSFCNGAFGNEPEDDQPPSPAPDDIEILDEFVGREVRRRAARGDADGDSRPQSQCRRNPDEK
jgi:hypothetical protein